MITYCFHRCRHWVLLLAMLKLALVRIALAKGFPTFGECGSDLRIEHRFAAFALADPAECNSQNQIYSRILYLNYLIICQV